MLQKICLLLFKFDLRVNVGDKPSEIVNETLRLWSDQADEEMPEFLDDYLLKVCGREEYFYSEYPLLQYTVILFYSN